MPEIELLNGVAELPRDDWNALVGEQSPFLEWDWLASLEEAGCVGPGTGWQPRPLVARENGRLLAACPLYVKSHSEGEFVFDWGWADAAERAGVRYYPKLLVGVPFTPVTGSRFLVAEGEDREHWIRQLSATLREICAANELSSVHVNFCREDETTPFESSEYHRRVGIQYHWRNHDYQSFDDYLDAFRSKKRNQIRRERRAMQAAGVAIETVAGDAIEDALFEPMFRCYMATIESHVYGRQYLNERFFELLRKRFKRRLCFVVARRAGRILAGTTNVVKGDTFYGRYWGALEPLRHLHFNVCYYAAIEWCIARGLARFEPGAGGDYKWLRGFEATPTYSLHFLREPRLAEAVGRFLAHERAEAAHVIDEMDRQGPLKRTRRGENPAPRR
ncbi:MAG: N-acetyltransferase [Deltaproteobacteria bacterium]|nr:N-acetyltransferase [Deltaproteobacteria bacterium]MBW2361887.1 N-acetyltransferase [Deltaproteobacteria bacterium]